MGRIANTMKFEDLKLPYGYPLQLQVQVDGQTQRATSKLIGCVVDQALLITLPKGNVRLRTGQKMVARIMVGNGICVFPVQIEAAINQPLPMMFLTYPRQVNFKEIRGATRVDVGVPVQADNLTSLPEKNSSGLIADISISGARLEVAEPIGEVGDELQLHGKVQIGPMERELALTAVIRSRVERSTHEVEENLPAVYGVQFVETNEDRLLLLHAFVNGHLAAK